MNPQDPLTWPDEDFRAPLPGELVAEDWQYFSRLINPNSQKWVSPNTSVGLSWENAIVKGPWRVPLWRLAVIGDAISGEYQYFGPTSQSWLTGNRFGNTVIWGEEILGVIRVPVNRIAEPAEQRFRFAPVRINTEVRLPVFRSDSDRRAYSHAPVSTPEERARIRAELEAPLPPRRR